MSQCLSTALVPYFHHCPANLYGTVQPPKTDFTFQPCYCYHILVSHPHLGKLYLLCNLREDISLRTLEFFQIENKFFLHFMFLTLNII